MNQMRAQIVRRVLAEQGMKLLDVGRRQIQDIRVAGLEDESAESGGPFVA